MKPPISTGRKKKKAKDREEPSLNLKDLAIETGVPDLAENHDHYLYGAPKKDR
ncbi:MAG: hypothetical protein ACMUIA_11110 [bacterium]